MKRVVWIVETYQYNDPETMEVFADEASAIAAFTKYAGKAPVGPIGEEPAYADFEENGDVEIRTVELLGCDQKVEDALALARLDADWKRKYEP
jgi:hypothetical protein